jgi:hypothetical protein
MSWNGKLDRTMQPPLIAGSQAARLTLCRQWQPAAEVTAGAAAFSAFFSGKRAANPQDLDCGDPRTVYAADGRYYPSS